MAGFFDEFDQIAGGQSGASTSLVPPPQAPVPATPANKPAIASQSGGWFDDLNKIAGPQQPSVKPPAVAPATPATSVQNVQSSSFFSDLDAIAGKAPADNTPAAWINKYSAQYGVDPAFVNAMMWQESRGNQNAVSPKGARGFMQLMPATAQGLGVDPKDPEQNIKGGIMYIRQMLEKYKGDPYLALAAYNAGPTAVDDAKGIPNIRETQDYVQRIMGRYGVANPQASLATQPGYVAAEDKMGVPYLRERNQLIAQLANKGLPTWQRDQMMERLKSLNQALDKNPDYTEGYWDDAASVGTFLEGVVTAPKRALQAITEPIYKRMQPMDWDKAGGSSVARTQATIWNTMRDAVGVMAGQYQFAGKEPYEQFFRNDPAMLAQIENDARAQQELERGLKPGELGRVNPKEMDHFDPAAGMAADVVRLAGKFAAEQASDPVNWPFFFVEGPAGATVRPMLRMGVDYAFSAMMGYGAYKGFENSASLYDTNRSIFDQRPEFWESLQEPGMSMLFSALGAKGGTEQAGLINVLKRLDENAKSQFGRPWTELNDRERSEAIYDLAKLNPAENPTDEGRKLIEQAEKLGLNRDFMSSLIDQRTGDYQAQQERYISHLQDIISSNRSLASDAWQEGVIPQKLYFGDGEDVSSHIAEQRRVRTENALREADRTIAGAPEKARDTEGLLLDAPSRTPEEWEAERERQRNLEASQIIDSGRQSIPEPGRPEDAAPRVDVAKAMAARELDETAFNKGFDNAFRMVNAVARYQAAGLDMSPSDLRILQLAKLAGIGEGEIRRFADKDSISAEDKLTPTPDEKERQLAAEALERARAEAQLRQAAGTMDKAAATAPTPEAADAASQQAQAARETADRMRQEREAADRRRLAAQGKNLTQNMGAQIPATIGNSSTVLIPGTDRKYGVRYAVVNLKDLTPSHGPLTWEKNDNAFQPRDTYRTDKTVQQDIENRAEKFEPGLVFNNAPTQDNGPSTVRSDGLIAGGNKRALIQLVAYTRGMGDKIRDAAVESAPMFGIDPGAIGPATKDYWPTIVRILDNDETDRAAMFRIGDDLNIPSVSSYSPEERAVAASKFITPEQMGTMVGVLSSKWYSIRDFLREENDYIVDIMQRSGMVPENQRTAFITPEGKLTEAGKDLFEEALLSKVIADPSVIRNARTNTPAILNKIGSSLAQLLRIKERNDVWDITPYIPDVLSLEHNVYRASEELNEIKAIHRKMERPVPQSDVDLYLHPEKYDFTSRDLNFGAPLRETPTPIVEALARLFEDKTSDIRSSLDQYIQTAESTDIKDQSGFGFFEPPKPWDAFNTAISKQYGIKIMPEDWFSLEPTPMQVLSEAGFTAIPDKFGMFQVERPGNEGVTVHLKREDITNAAAVRDLVNRKIDEKIQKGSPGSIEDLKKRYGIQDVKPEFPSAPPANEHMIPLEMMENPPRAEFEPEENDFAPVEGLKDKPGPTVFLTRHGDTDMNGTGGASTERIRGTKDVPLNDVGIDDARRLAVSLEGKGITHIISSPMERAHETAKIIGERLGVPVTTDDRLKPWDLGKMTGEPVKEVAKDMMHYTEHPTEKVPGGQAYGASYGGYSSIMKEVMDDARNNGTTPLLVGHSRLMLSTPHILTDGEAPIAVRGGPMPGSALMLRDGGDGFKIADVIDHHAEEEANAAEKRTSTEEGKELAPSPDEKLASPPAETVQEPERKPSTELTPEEIKSSKGDLDGAEDHLRYIRAQLDRFPNTTPEQREAVLSLWRANAQHLGMSLPEWVQKHISDIDTSTPADRLQNPKALYQALPQHVEEAIRKGGGEPKGGMEWTDLAFFDDPETKATLALRMDEVSPETVRQHIEESRAKGDYPLYQHGLGMASEEELGRGEVFYRVSRSGALTYQGVSPDANLGNGEALIAVKKDGSMRVQNQSMGMSDASVLERVGPRIQEARKPDPLFQGNKKGAVRFLDDGSAIIHGFQSGDISTLVHETAHIFRRTMTPDELKIAEDWLGVDRGQWLRSHEESFARGFERYLYEGKAPNAGMKALFEQFKNWLRGIYQRLVGSPIGEVKLNDTARELYSRILGARDAQAEAAARDEAIEAAQPKPRRTQKPKAVSNYLSDDELPEYFQPGRIVTTYTGERDKVIAFHEGIPGAGWPKDKWNVDVIRVDKDGNPLPGARVRNHGTMPDRREIAAFRKEQAEKKTEALAPPPDEALPEQTQALREAEEKAGQNYQPDKAVLVNKDDAQALADRIRQRMQGAGEPDGLKPPGDILFQAVRRRAKMPEGPALPGMESHIEAQKESAAEVSGEELSKRLVEPPKDISKQTGEMERRSPLFGGVEEASGQGGLFGHEDDDTGLLFQDGDRLPPDVMRDTIMLGIHHFEAGDRSYSGWASAMVRDVGAWVQPHLQEVFEKMPIAARRMAQDAMKRLDMSQGDRVRAIRAAEAFNSTAKILSDANQKSSIPEIIIPKGVEVDENAGLSQGQVYPEDRPSNGQRAQSDASDRNPQPAGTQRGNRPEPGNVATQGVGSTRNEPVTGRPGATGRNDRNQERPPGKGVDVSAGKGTAKATDTGASGGRVPEKPAASEPPAAATGALRKVPAARLDAPRRSRGTPVYDPQEWADMLTHYNIPENAPVPFVKISEDTRASLLPGQAEIVEIALSGLLQHDAFVMAPSTGTGKTFLASAIISELRPEHTLILSKSQNLLGPVSERNSFAQVAYDHFGLEAKPLPQDFQPNQLESGIYTVTYARARDLSEELAQHHWGLVVADEAGEARRWFESSQGDMLKKLGESSNTDKILYSSATPFHNALEVGYLSRLGLWDSEGFDKWAEQFGVRTKVDRATGEVTYSGGHAPRKLLKLREQLIERGSYINLDRDMTGVTSHFGVVPLTDAQQLDIRNAMKAFNLAGNYFRATGKPGLMAAAKASQVSFIKNYIERARLPQAIELGKKLEAQGWRVIYFTENKAERQEIYDFLQNNIKDPRVLARVDELMPRFNSVDNELTKAFGNRLANFSGPDSAARRSELKSFREGTKPHIYATYAAGGIGVGMHDTIGDAPRAAVYIGLPWSGVMFDQATGRPWRYGTKSNASFYFLTSDARPEINLVTDKVAPRLESLKAVVSGISADPTVEAMQTINGAIEYALGNEQTHDVGDFSDTVKVPITRWDQLPIDSAKDAMNKGLRLPEPYKPKKSPSVLGQDIGDIPPALDDHPDAAAEENIATAEDARHPSAAAEGLTGQGNHPSYLDWADEELRAKAGLPPRLSDAPKPPDDKFGASQIPPPGSNEVDPKDLAYPKWSAAALDKGVPAGLVAPFEKAETAVRLYFAKAHTAPYTLAQFPESKPLAERLLKAEQGKRQEIADMLYTVLKEKLPEFGIKEGTPEDQQVYEALRKSQSPATELPGKVSEVTESAFPANVIDAAQWIRDNIYDPLWERAHEVRPDFKYRRQYATIIQRLSHLDFGHPLLRGMIPADLMPTMSLAIRRAIAKNPFSPYLLPRKGNENLNFSIHEVMRAYVPSLLKVIHDTPAIYDGLRIVSEVDKSSQPLLREFMERYLRHYAGVPSEYKETDSAMYRFKRQLVEANYNALLEMNPHFLGIRLLHSIQNSFPDMGAKYVMAGMMRLRTAEGRELLARSGVMNDIQPSRSKVAQVGREILHSISWGTDYLNRGLSYLGALEKAKDLGMLGDPATVGDITMDRLRELAANGVDVEQALDYAYDNVARNQFMYTPAYVQMQLRDTPLILQFKSWPIRTAELIHNMLANAKTEPAKAARLIGSLAILGAFGYKFLHLGIPPLVQLSSHAATLLGKVLNGNSNQEDVDNLLRETAIDFIPGAGYLLRQTTKEEHHHAHR